MLAGVVSMPVTTRLLSQEQYGALSLVLVTVSLLGTLGRLGFPQAVIRFYAARRAAGRAVAAEFCNTMLTGAVCGGVILALVALGLIDRFGDPAHTAVTPLRLGLLVVVIRVAGSVAFEILRADEEVRRFAATQVAVRWIPVLLGIALLLLWQRAATAVVAGLVVGEGLVTLAVLLMLARAGQLTAPAWSWPVARTALAYGLPLTVVGAGSGLLRYGDRYLIEAFLGTEAVAAYAVPYDLAGHLMTLLFLPIQLAALPITYRLWAEQGSGPTAAFASRVLGYVLALAVPAGVLYLVLGQQLVVLFASPRYAPSAALIPYFLPGVLLEQISVFATVGLLLARRTVVAAAITVCGAALNIGLNLLLLPAFGLPGAAAATSIASVCILASSYVVARQTLPLRPAARTIGAAVAGTTAAAALLLGVGAVSTRAAVDLAVRGLLGAGTVGAIVLALDRDTRALAADAAAAGARAFRLRRERTAT